MLKIILPLLLLVGSVLLGKYLIATGPEPKKKPSFERVPVVEVMPLKREDYTVYVRASGIVKAGIQSNLVAEVSGKVVKISDDFQEGAYFDKNQTLIEINKAQYSNAVSIAESEIAANRASLKQIIEEEKSSLRSIHLARKNILLGKKEENRVKALWNKRLIARSLLDAEQQKVNQLEQKLQDLQGKQNTFSSRRLAIEAKINASLARLKQEQLNLSYTNIKVPYAGRVLKKKVDVGQFVSKGTVLGETYATDYVNVELPLTLNQYELLEIPETYRNKSLEKTKVNFPEVIFSAPGSIRNATWKGRIVRSSAALNTESRQINVIARIDHPFDFNKSNEASAPLRIGQYLTARIKGKTFRNVFVLPPATVRLNKELLLLRKGKIDVVEVKVLWNSPEVSIVSSDQNIVGEQLLTTSLAQAKKGLRVITLEEQRNKNKLKNASKQSTKDKVSK